VGDFDGDGDLDVAISRREAGTLYWYETRPEVSGWEWACHTACAPEDPALRKGLEDSLGAAVLDVDGDGWLDVAVNRVWFENPGTLDRTPGARWAAHPYRGGRHDITAADIDLDGRADLLTRTWGAPGHHALRRGSSTRGGRAGTTPSWWTSTATATWT
jgi:hypothetical protein